MSYVVSTNSDLWVSIWRKYGWRIETLSCEKQQAVFKAPHSETDADAAIRFDLWIEAVSEVFNGRVKFHSKNWTPKARGTHLTEGPIETFMEFESETYAIELIFECLA